MTGFSALMTRGDGNEKPMSICNDPVEQMTLIPKLAHESIKKSFSRIDSLDTNVSLLEALSPHQAIFSQFEKQLRQGVTIWSMSHMLTKLREQSQSAIEILPTPDISPDPTFNNLMRAEALTTSSTIFRTWTSLVYMRPDKIMTTINSITEKPEVLAAYAELANNKHVKHIRNSISHGTFDAEFQIFEYHDKNMKTGFTTSGKISYQELDKLNEHIFALWTSIWAISIKAVNSLKN